MKKRGGGGAPPVLAGRDQPGRVAPADPGPLDEGVWGESFPPVGSGAKPRLLHVGQAEAGQKLVQYLGRVLGKDVPGSVFMRWIRTGQVRVDGRRAKPFDRLALGQAVRLPPFAQIVQTEASEPAPLDLPLVGETEDWLIIAKPAGLPAHPGSGWSDSVQTRLGRAHPGQTFVPTIAHRLDRDTSGILLAAKTYQALTDLQLAFRQGQVKKEYLAWVKGAWELSDLGQPVGLKDRLAKAGPFGREKMALGQGKLAVLEARPMIIEPDRSLLVIRLFTGRTHQIRAQLAGAGHPVQGDAKYGEGKPPMFLHAWRLSLPGGTFVCPPPWAGRWRVDINARQRPDGPSGPE